MRAILRDPHQTGVVQEREIFVSGLIVSIGSETNESIESDGHRAAILTSPVQMKYCVTPSIQKRTRRCEVLSMRPVFYLKDSLEPSLAHTPNSIVVSLNPRLGARKESL